MSDVINAAYYIAKRSGLRGLTRDRIAALARVSTGSVSYQGGSMEQIVSKVVEKAIEEKELKIIAEALVQKHPLAMAAPLALRRAAVNSLVG